MKHAIRILSVFILIVALFAGATSASATKRLYKATLTTGAELHQVVGSSARGNFVLGYNLDGSMHFFLTVRNVSGQVNATHLHGPATTEQNASARITLCGGGPGIPSVATCTTSDGVFSIEGDITSAQLASVGITGAAFSDMLENSLF